MTINNPNNNSNSKSNSKDTCVRNLSTSAPNPQHLYPTAPPRFHAYYYVSLSFS